MKHLSAIFIIILLLAGISSCKKKEKGNTHIYGKITDGCTNNAISSASIVIIEQGGQIGAGQSDGSGNFDIIIPGEHEFVTIHTIYSDYCTSAVYYDLNNETFEEHCDFTIYPPAYLKIIAQKTETVLDSITFYSMNWPTLHDGITITNPAPLITVYEKVHACVDITFGYSAEKIVTGFPPAYYSSSEIINTLPRDTTDVYLTY